MSDAVRFARRDEADLVLALLAEFWAESGYPLDRAAARAAIDALLADASLGRLWLVLDGDAPVGYLALTFGFSLEYLGRDAFIDNLYVRPAHRGRGLGSRAMADAESAARALGVRALHLEVERGNRPAHSLYRARGFRDNDRRLMSKRLEPAGAVEPGS